MAGQLHHHKNPSRRLLGIPREGFMKAAPILATVFLFGLQAAPASAADPVLDYDFFKRRVEPIFLTKRPDHVRCYVCHSESNNAFKLEKLETGKAFWTEEQSRRQFEAISRLVVPGEPTKSMLLMRPLAPEEGGYAYHSGGRQFESKNSPEWKTLSAWVNGEKLQGK
jgi:hypothetical protein